MKRFVLLCLVFCTLSLAQVEGLETAFKSSSTHRYFWNMEDWAQDMKHQHKCNSFNWRGEGFYIIRHLDNNHFYGTAVAFLPVNSVFLTSRFIMKPPNFYSGDVYECDDCLLNTIHRHREKIKKMCTANFTITKEFYNLIKRFIDEDRLSIGRIATKIVKSFYTPKGDLCTYNFFVIYQDKNGNRKYFDMIPSMCIDNEMRKNPIVDEYIELYDTFDSLFTTKYYDCRWDRVSSKEEIIQQCGKCKLEFINYEE
ncbi:MAG: hypothetical protein MJZ76_11235 [Bacteroidales bacterium]|nr:hypothetical protein [Bacteroidales bacterium]